MHRLTGTAASEFSTGCTHMILSAMSWPISRCCCRLLWCRSVVQVLHSPWLLRTLQSPPQRTLQQVLTDYMPRAELLMQQGNPHVSKGKLGICYQTSPLLM